MMTKMTKLRSLFFQYFNLFPTPLPHMRLLFELAILSRAKRFFLSRIRIKV